MAITCVYLRSYFFHFYFFFLLLNTIPYDCVLQDWGADILWYTILYAYYHVCIQYTYNNYMCAYVACALVVCFSQTYCNDITVVYLIFFLFLSTRFWLPHVYYNIRVSVYACVRVFATTEECVSSRVTGQ